MFVLTRVCGQYGANAVIIENAFTKEAIARYAKAAMGVFQNPQIGVLDAIQSNHDGLRWYAVPTGDKEWNVCEGEIAEKLLHVLNDSAKGDPEIVLAKQRNASRIGILYSLQGCSAQMPHLDAYEGTGISWIIPLGSEAELLVWHTEPHACDLCSKQQ